MRLVTDPTAPLALDDDLLIEGDNAAVLPLLPRGAFDLVYVDPPFNTGGRRTGGGHTAARGAPPPAGAGGLRRPGLPAHRARRAELRRRLRRLRRLAGPAARRGARPAGRARLALRA